MTQLEQCQWRGEGGCQPATGQSEENKEVKWMRSGTVSVIVTTLSPTPSIVPDPACFIKFVII